MKKVISLLFLAVLVYPHCMAQTLPPAPNPNDIVVPDPRGPVPHLKFQPHTLKAPLQPKTETVHVTVVDPNVPGIKLATAEDSEFAARPELARQDRTNMVILKNSSQRTIVGLSIFLQYSSGKGGHYNMDGLVSPWNGVGPGQMLPASPGHMGAISFGEEESNRVNKVSIDWMLMDDGTFYGSQKDADDMLVRIKARKEFFREVTASSDRESYVQRVEKFTENRLSDASRTPKEWGQMGDAARLYRRIAIPSKPHAEETLRWLADAVAKYPSIKKVVLTEKQPIKPLDDTANWRLKYFAGSCYQGGPAQYQIHGVGDCKWDTYRGPYAGGVLNPPGYGPIGEPQTITGQIVDAAGVCVDTQTGAIGEPIGKEFHPGYINPVYTTWLGYVPRHYSYTSIDPDIYGDGVVINSFHEGLTYGFSEPTGPAAKIDPTQTTLCWLAYSPILGPYTNASATGFPNANGAPLMLIPPLFSSNTTASWNLNGYGFMTYNVDILSVCDNPNNPTYSPLMPDGAALVDGAPNPWFVMPIIYNPIQPRLECFVYENASIGPTPGDSTAWASYCSCVDGGGTFNSCGDSLFGGTTVPLCWDGGGVGDGEDSGGGDEGGGVSGGYGDYGGVGVVEQGGMVNTPPDFGLPMNALTYSGFPNELGFYRGGGSFYSHEFFLDAYWENAVTSDTITISNLTNPVGFNGVMQAGDITVSGDWNGDGTSKVGFFRPTTGEWYLDMNGNGTYDGTANGDAYYLFGGLMLNTPGPNGTQIYGPQDVPVVGDWTGSGKDCIGVFRSGVWLLDLNCNGTFDGAPADAVYGFGGLPGDVPVVGHWIPTNGAVMPVQVGFVRCYIPYAGSSCQSWPFYWILDSAYANDNNQNDHQIAEAFAFGGIGTPNPQVPSGPIYTVLPGYFPTTSNAAAASSGGDIFVTGDWTGTGQSLPGAYRFGTWVQATQLGAGGYNLVYGFGGNNGDQPLVGKIW